MKLHIGCGKVHLDGWTNIDADSPLADLHHDVRQPLPFADRTVHFIFAEHFIEHLTLQEGLAFFRDCHRLLNPGGVLRIATPDLDYTLFRYFFFWKWRSWYKKFGYDWVKTRAESVNISFREWGHQYLYNGQELKRRLLEAGFSRVRRVRRGRSRFAELHGLETRKESNLVVEASKADE